MAKSLSMSISYNCSNLLHVKPHKRPQAFGFHSLGHIPNSRLGDRFLFIGNHITRRGRQMKQRSNRDLTVCSRTPKESNPFTCLADLRSWLSWLPRLLALTPLLAQRLLAFTWNVKPAVKTVEQLADDVEEVAEDVEKAAEDIEKKLPAGGGKLKEMGTSIESLAEDIAKDAQLTKDLMAKVEEVDKEIRVIHLQ